MIPINCAPLVRCGHEGRRRLPYVRPLQRASRRVSLTWRSPSYEWSLGDEQANAWDTALIFYGLLGIAIGAFHWTVSTWFVQLKQIFASWLIDHNILWPLDTNAPWFLFTHYPEQNDVFSWLDGSMVIGYIVVTGLVYGTVLLGLLAAGTRTLAASSSRDCII